LDSAGWLLERAVAAMPNQPYLHASQGNLYFARGMIPEMTDSYRRALLKGYFREIPAPFADIISRVGSPPRRIFPPIPVNTIRSICKTCCSTVGCFAGFRTAFLPISARMTA
jgi:hypothetical protein